MDIEDLHLACLAQAPADGGPCDLADLGEAPKPPPAGGRWRLFARVTEADRERAAQRPPLILSCSRRTDVPWAFLRQYLKAFREGFMYVRNPASGEPEPVCLRPYDPNSGKGVLCIGWWSKNYAKWIEEFEREGSVLHRYPVHMFNFTVNSDDPVLEPGLRAPLEERLAQVAWLAQRFGPHALNVRFDPIVHYRFVAGGPVRDNLRDFQRIVGHLGGLGVRHVTFSFCRPYRQSLRNMLSAGVELVALSREQQRAVLDELLPLAHRHGVEMRCCCDAALLGHRACAAAPAGPEVRRWRRWGLPGKECGERRAVLARAEVPSVGESRCLDARLADRLARELGLTVTFPHQKDRGQREECNCTGAREIGQYELQCPHSCLYCYANPKPVEPPASGPPEAGLVHREGQAPADARQRG